jgi:hypothetical protein
VFRWEIARGLQHFAAPQQGNTQHRVTFGHLDLSADTAVVAKVELDVKCLKDIRLTKFLVLLFHLEIWVSFRAEKGCLRHSPADLQQSVRTPGLHNRIVVTGGTESRLNHKQ